MIGMIRALGTLVSRFHVHLLAVSVGLTTVGGVGVVSTSTPQVDVKVLGERITRITKGGLTPAKGGNGGGGGNNGNGLGNGGGDKLSFTMSATVSGLTPGAQDLQLPVQVGNPSTNNGALTVTTLSVVPQDVVVGGSVVCAGSNLTVTPYDSSAAGATQYVIPRGGSATVPLPVLLVDSSTVNQDGCRGRTFPLTINGTATVTR